MISCSYGIFHTSSFLVFTNNFSEKYFIEKKLDKQVSCSNVFMFPVKNKNEKKLKYIKTSAFAGTNRPDGPVCVCIR